MILALSDVAAMVGGELVGDGSVLIRGLAAIDECQLGDVVFAESARYFEAALRSPAAAVIVPATLARAANKPTIVVESPRQAFSHLLKAFAPPFAKPASGIDATASVGEGTAIGDSTSVGEYVTIGPCTVVGARVTIHAGARVGAGCHIGNDTVIYPNAVLYPGVTVGERCILHSGCVIGSDGFGYIAIEGSLEKVPHIGTVILEDDVEVGANSCIDRAKTGATVVGSGSKLDNLVHVAHNVTIGKMCLVVGQAGIAGSVQIGDGVILAGQAGLADHIKVGSGARVGAQGGVIGDVAPGQVVSGYPARPHGQKMREYAALTTLPELIKRVRALEKQLALLNSAGNSERNS